MPRPCPSSGFAPGLPALPRPRDYSSQAPLRGGAGASWDAERGARPGAMAPWGERLAGVRGVLLDISGVLYDSGAGGGTAIAGSVEAVAR